MKTKLIQTTLLLLAAILPLTAAAEKLVLGGPAPPLATGKFVQGEKVTELEKGKVYIVEFWNLKCGPCVPMIPHINALQKKYAHKGLVVIGQNVGDKDENQVKRFIARMGNQMTYRVALDDIPGGQRGKMATTWLQASDYHGLPWSLVVDQEGRIIYMGHPNGLYEKVLDEIFDGTFDPQAHAEKLKVLEKNTPAFHRKFFPALKEKRFDDAREALSEMKAFEDTRWGWDVRPFRFSLYVESGDGKAAQQEADAIFKLAGEMEEKERAFNMLVHFTRAINSRQEELEGFDRTLAVRMAQKAVEMFGGTRLYAHTNLATAKLLAGDRDGAIALLEKMIHQSQDQREKAFFLASLQEIKAHKAK